MSFRVFPGGSTQALDDVQVGRLALRSRPGRSVMPGASTRFAVLMPPRPRSIEQAVSYASLKKNGIGP